MLIFNANVTTGGARVAIPAADAPTAARRGLAQRGGVIHAKPESQRHWSITS